MKFNYKLCVFFIAIALTTGCTDDFEELNTNPTSPAQVPGDFLFTNVQWGAFQGGFWVNNVLHVGNWMQHYGNQNSGFTMAHYFDRGQDMAGYWNGNFLNLADLKKAVEEIDKQDEGEFANVKKAIIEIQAVEIWYYFTQMVGDIPYSQALQPEEFTFPAYDAQESIIADLFNRLDAAVSTLSGASIPFGNADVFYAGVPAQWVKYGNSLKLKMALGIDQGDASLASSMASAAMQGPILESTADNAVLPTDNGGPAFRHPNWSLDGLGSSDRPYLGETLINILIDSDDPRLPIIASPTERSVAAGGALEYKGVPGAPDDALYAVVNANLDDYSFPNADWMSGRTTSYNKGVNRMTFAEISFYKAEAVVKGYASGDAQQFFEDGIRAAMTVPPFSDAGVTEDQINTYIAANGTLAGSADEQLAQIHTQLYIQHFMDQEFDVFLDWRRTGLPQLTQGLNQGETGGVIPRRYKYSESEPVINSASYNAAVGQLSDGDSYLSRLWSDQ